MRKKAPKMDQICYLPCQALVKLTLGPNGAIGVNIPHMGVTFQKEVSFWYSTFYPVLELCQADSHEASSHQETVGYMLVY